MELRNKVIDFFIKALTEMYIEDQNNPHQYYGHNFNYDFKILDENVRMSLYVALTMFFTQAKNEKPKEAWVYVALEYLKICKSDIKAPTAIFTKNKDLIWNLYYQLQRITE